jgi:hypothetical protein
VDHVEADCGCSVLLEYAGTFEASSFRKNLERISSTCIDNADVLLTLLHSRTSRRGRACISMKVTNFPEQQGQLFRLEGASDVNMLRLPAKLTQPVRYGPRIRPNDYDAILPKQVAPQLSGNLAGCRIGDPADGV